MKRTHWESNGGMQKSRKTQQIPNIQQREFGFLFPSRDFHRDGKRVMCRHLAFPSNEALWEFIEKNKPLDCYISTAYYENPSARKMNAKGWKGADLYFDLDGDPDELTDVKGEAVVIQYVLKHDFDIDSQLIFSGCKGYHVLSMTDDDKVLTMKSDARRAVIDYLKEKYKCRFIDGSSSCDIHRLRRLPGTTNSKSGKVAYPIMEGEACHSTRASTWLGGVKIANG